MKNIGFLIIALCAAVHLRGQELKDSTIAAGVYSARFERVVAEGGVTVPLGSMRQHMNVAPNIGFWIRQKRSERSVVNYGTSLNFPAQRRFNYSRSEETAITRSFSGFVGAQFDKVFPLSYRRYVDVEWGTAVGYAFYFYDDLRARDAYAALPRDVKTDKDNPTFIKPLSSVFIGQSLKLRIRDFGMQARYNFTPYSAFSRVVDSSFGMHSVSIGLFYRQ
ncbi:hypothetical protein [Sphingobacterium bambusae]|uniref:Outer membrane protein beta-barrel domain-containing protein n=1 Tax=Sphingobacterium bambusae TaxID=662858 RepID=A0ABW6B996_9SPHI|nr:hypothetical protein [Sphingobacterium bambusae]WPL48235.1 hypothetical protein SCB77_20005 [Sphingobacterium bambusae]